jgi:signal peptidase II
VAGAGPSADGETDGVNTNGVLFWPVAVLVGLADLATKAFAEAALGAPGFPHRVLGDAVRFTLVYNPGAAFNLHLGPYSRGIFLALTAVVLRVLWGLYRRTPDRDNLRVLALALLCSGAVGNAIDRVRSAQGVVDWLDVGVGAHRWPTFNVADVAVTAGAVLLFRVLWREERAAAAAPARAEPARLGAEAR